MDYFIVKRFMYYVKLVWRNEMLQNISDGFEKFFCEIRDEIRQRHSEIIDDYVLDERIKGIENTSLALCEAKVEDEVIVFLLIKYWDLRPSEAKEIFQETKRLLDINR